MSVLMDDSANTVSRPRYRAKTRARPVTCCLTACGACEVVVADQEAYRWSLMAPGRTREAQVSAGFEVVHGMSLALDLGWSLISRSAAN